MNDKHGETRMEVFAFIVKYMLDNNGRAPTNREIVKNTRVGTISQAAYHKEMLHKDGYIEVPMTKAEKNKKKARQIYITSSVFAIPRNVMAGNLHNVTETSVFIDYLSPHAKELMAKFGGSPDHDAHWYSDETSRDIAFKVLHPKQVAVISNNPYHTLMAIAYGAAVYLPENVINDEN